MKRLNMASLSRRIEANWLLANRVWHRKALLQRLGLAIGLTVGLVATAQAADAPAGSEPATAEVASQEPADAAAETGPVAEPLETEHDFGEVWAGPALKHTFKVKNAGNEPLKIINVKPGCGCTATNSYPSEIAPGDVGDFTFSLMSTKVHNRFKKPIRIATNDPANKVVTLYLTGTSKRKVEVKPYAAYFGVLRDDEPQSRTLKVENHMNEPVKLAIDPPDNDKFAYELKQVEEGKKWELTVRTKPPYEPGLVRSNLRIHTSVNDPKFVDVRVTATKPDRLRVVPTKILLTRSNNVRPGQQQTIYRHINFENYGDKPVKVLEATVDDPKVTTQIHERQAGKEYQVVVQFPADYEAPPEGKTVTLKTDDDEHPEFKVPIEQYPRRRTRVAKPAQQRVEQAKQDQKPQARRRRPALDLINKEVPDFELTTLAGKKVTDEELEGEIAILNFVAPNCGWCKRQVPDVEKVREKFDDKDVRFINISRTKMRDKELSADEVKEIWNEKLNAELELALDPNDELRKIFKVVSSPTMFVVDKEGRIKYVNIGGRDKGPLVEAQLTSLVTGKPFEAPKPQRPQRPAMTLDGEEAPSFELTTLDGETISDEAFQDKITVLNFVAANCGWSKRQIKDIEPIRKEYEPKGVRFVNVIETMRKEYSNDEIVEVMTELGSKMEIAPDRGNKVGRLYKATGYPTMFVIDEEGMVEHVNIGGRGQAPVLKAQLESMITGKPYQRPKPQAPRRPALTLKGKEAPEFELDTLEGKSISSEDFDEQVTVLNFVAADCGWSRRQLKDIEPVRAQFADKGVRFINVIETMRREFTTEQVKEVLDSLGSKMEIAPDDGNRVGRMYKATSFPTMFVVDTEGKIAHVNIGGRGQRERLQSQLQEMIKTEGQSAGTTAGAPTTQPRS